MSKLFLGPLIVALILGIPNRAIAADADVSVAAIERAEATVVPIACIDATTTPPTIREITGTGFFVGTHGFIVTPAHVFSAALQADHRIGAPCEYAAYIPQGGWAAAKIGFSYVAYRIGKCVYAADADVAACPLLENPFASEIARRTIRAAVLHIEPLPDGTPIAFTGFPLGNQRPLTSKGDIAANYVAVEGAPVSGIVIDRAAWPGASGSPVYAADNSVVGMVIRAGTAGGISQGLSYALPAADIANALRAFGVDFEQR